MNEEKFRCKHEYCLAKNAEPLKNNHQYNKHINTCGKRHLACYNIYGPKDCNMCKNYGGKLKAAIEKKSGKRANKGLGDGYIQCSHTCGPHGARCTRSFKKTTFYKHLQEKAAHPWHQSCVSCNASTYLSKVMCTLLRPQQTSSWWLFPSFFFFSLFFLPFDPCGKQ
jgi:hypothetical protein